MKKIEPYFLDDSCEIPEDIKRMSEEELKAEIRHLEEEARKKREKKPRLAAIS